MRTLVWFRGKDLRVSDHAPLRDAVERGEIVPLFVLDPYFFAPKRAAALPYRMQFLLESLTALEANLAHLGSKLTLVAGKSVEVVPRLAKEWKADRVVAHRWVEPFGRERDERVRAALHVPFELFEGETLLPPGTLRTGGGEPYSVYTPFSHAFVKTFELHEPKPAPKKLPPVPADVTTKSAKVPSLEDLGLTPNRNLQRGGERAARQRLDAFFKGPASGYPDLRNRMDTEGTSRLSADLKFGTISARTVYAAASKAMKGAARASYLNELTWREFTHSTLWDRPQLLEQPFRERWAGFPWLNDAHAWKAWTEGTTGYPVVDASARQLLGEGYVHNRARMISASFFTKHLLGDYRKGEAHYLKWLTDGDWAQNNAGWQWSTGCGCDAQPYFRIFNPVSQGERFDPEGDYVRQWVPELKGLPAKYIHSPWAAPAGVLAAAGVTLGMTYPLPIVEHAAARGRFLAVAKQHLGASPSGNTG